MTGKDSDPPRPPSEDDVTQDDAPGDDSNATDEGGTVIDSSDRFAGLGEAIAAAAAEVESDASDDVYAEAPIPVERGGFQPRLVVGSGGSDTDDEEDGPDDDDVDEETEAAARQLLEDLDRLQGERNEYLEQLLRTKADFENYRKRILKQQAEHVERAAEELVEKLLEVLDVYDGAKAHSAGFEQVGASLLAALEKEGLVRIDPAGAAFDPTEADAVMHEEGDDGPVVSDVLRPGYRWKGRVVRPAMVKVRG